VSPPAPAPELEGALVRACTEAAHRECGISAPGAEAPPTARITWSSESTADVEVTSQDGTQRRVRHITFRPTDREIERWQALGLVVASLVTTEEGSAPVELEPAKPMTLPRRAHNAVWVGLGALVGNGMSPGPLRYGGWLRAGYQIAGSPAFVSLGSSYAIASENANGIEGQWATFSLGGGGQLEWAALRLFVRPALEVSFQRMSAGAVQGTAVGPTSGSRWVPATQAVLSLCWPARSSVALTLGGVGTFATGATGVRSGGAEVASFPGLAYALTLGIEVDFSN
jgi:hypothetical protein